MDDAVLMKGGQGGEDRHEQDPGFLPGEVPFFGGQQVVPEGLGPFDVFTDCVSGIVFFKDLPYGDEGGQTVHLLQFAPKFEETAEEAVVGFLRAFPNEKGRGFGTSADHGVRQELPDGDRDLGFSVIPHISGPVSVGLGDGADEVMAADDGPHGEEGRQLQRVVVEMAVGALLRRAFFLHAVHAQVFVGHACSPFVPQIIPVLF